MKKEKKYTLPEEIAKLFILERAYKKLRNAYAKIPFCYKKALKCAIKKQEYDDMAWREIYKLYPEIKYKELNADITNRELRIIQ